MKDNKHQSPLFSDYKDKAYKTQLQTIFQYLQENVATASMVSIETGILRANICRYVAEWEKENLICIVRKGICPISKHRAGFYTTNPELFPIIEPSNTVKL